MVGAITKEGLLGLVPDKLSYGMTMKKITSFVWHGSYNDKNLSKILFTFSKQILMILKHV